MQTKIHTLFGQQAVEHYDISESDMDYLSYGIHLPYSNYVPKYMIRIHNHSSRMMGDIRWFIYKKRGYEMISELYSRHPDFVTEEEFNLILLKHSAEL
jgi:hypothetical protein